MLIKLAAQLFLPLIGFHISCPYAMLTNSRCHVQARNSSVVQGSTPAIPTAVKWSVKIICNPAEQGTLRKERNSTPKHTFTTN